MARQPTDTPRNRPITDAPGGGRPTPPADQPAAPNIPVGFLRRLDEAGLAIGPDGTVIEVGGARRVAGVNSAKKNDLLQEAFFRFGLGNNEYDTSRLAYINNGEVGVSLDLGGYTNGQGVASDAQLEHLRLLAGWTPEQSYDNWMKRYSQQTVNDYVPVPFRSVENYSNWLRVARADYVENYGQATPEPAQPAAPPPAAPPPAPPAGFGYGNTGGPITPDYFSMEQLVGNDEEV